MKLARPVVLALLLSLNLVSAAGKEIDPEEEWMGIYSGENRVGYSYTLFRRKRGIKYSRRNQSPDEYPGHGPESKGKVGLLLGRLQAYGL